jgi:hypothetical protein
MTDILVIYSALLSTAFVMYCTSIVLEFNRYTIVGHSPVD